MNTNKRVDHEDDVTSSVRTGVDDEYGDAGLTDPQVSVTTRGVRARASSSFPRR